MFDFWYSLERFERKIVTRVDTTLLCMCFYNLIGSNFEQRDCKKPYTNS